MKTFRSAQIGKIRIIPFAFMSVFFMVLMGSGGFAFAASHEQHDPFCASCHTQPVSTYFQRSIEAAPVDLASAHQLKDTQCIECHSGMGLTGRISAELMGAQNAFKWYTGIATQPAPLLYPIGDDHCIKCHAGVTTESHDSNVRTRQFGPKGHYHALLAQWRGVDQNAARCTDCHAGHAMGGDTKSSWVVSASVQNACEACHKTLGQD